MIIAMTGGFLISVFLMLRISYRQVIAAVQSTLPSGQSMRDAVTSAVRDSSSTKSPSLKTSAVSASARKKELDHELELARAARALEAQSEDSAPSVVR